MNKVQKNYMVAVANLKALKEEERILEENYLKENGFDCNVIYAIESEEDFDKANEELSKIMEQNGLWNKICKAEEVKKEAEEKLIQYALSIIPFPKERETLRKASKTNWKVRQEMIDLVMKLDTRTVKAI